MQKSGQERSAGPDKTPPNGPSAEPWAQRGRWLRLLRSSRPLRLLLVGGVLALAAIAGSTVLIITELRDRKIQDAEQELATLNFLLAETTARAIQSVDLVLSSTVEQLAGEAIATSADFERLKAGHDTYEDLRARTVGIPQLDAITMIAADGRLINFSRYFPIPPVNVSDRDYFAALKDTPTDRPFLSEPVQNRGNGNWTIYLARRVNGPSGTFVGLVLAAINLDYFQSLYQSLHIGEGAAISLWRRDGILLARWPVLDRVGERIPIKSFTEILTRADAGVYEIKDSIDGAARIVSTRLVRDYPVVVNVTRTMGQALYDWRRQAWITGVTGLVCAAALVCLIWALARQFSTYEAITQALSERQQAVEARRDAEARLSQMQKMETLGQLTGGIAHDFNNLLQAIGSGLYMIEQQAGKMGAPNGLVAPVRLAQQAVERGSTLTQHLLAFSRRQHLEPRPVDVNGLVEGMGGLLERTLGGTIYVRTVLQDGLWPAMVDPTQLEMALLNLAINARDAMPDGGTVTISTATVARNRAARGVGDTGVPPPPADLPPGDYVGVSVRDTGTGMPEEVAARAFEPFFTTKAVGHGTGLGLSMVHGLAAQSGGGIRLDSRPGRGTAVTLYLPRAAQAEGEGGHAPAAAPAAVEPSSACVLLVEDDALVRQTTSAFLKQAGVRVLEALGTAEALELLTRPTVVDLLITDFAMPGMNGLELSRAARAIRPNLPVVLVSGYADSGALAAEALDPGSRVLTKPFKPDQLLATIRNMLG